MDNQRCLIVALIILASGICAAQQGDAKTTTDPPASFVFVPYDKATGPELGGDRTVMIPYAEFLKLKAATGVKPDGPEFKPRASLAQSTFTGKVEGRVALIDAEFVIETLARDKDELSVDLPFANASIERSSVEGATSSLAPLEKVAGIRVTMRGEGRRVIKVKLATTLSVDGPVIGLSMGIPRAAAASLSLSVDGKVSLENTKGAAPATATMKDGETVIRASCGSLDRVTLFYRPEVTPTGAATSTRIATHQEIHLSVSSRAARAQVFLNVETLAGKCGSLALKIPKGTRLVAVSGDFVQDWTPVDKEGVSKITLSRPTDQLLKVAFNVELDARNEGRLTVPEFRVIDAVRESGSIDLLPDGDLSVWIEESEGLQAKSINVKDAPGARSFSFAQPGWRLALSRRPIASRILADSVLLYGVSEELVQLKTRHRLAISGRGVFAVSFEAPEGYELREAGPPALVSGYRQTDRRVDVNFRSEQVKACDVLLTLQRVRGAFDEDVSLDPIVVHGASEDAGAAVLAAPTALRATELASTGLEATDVRTFQADLKSLLSSDWVPVLGYRYFTPRFSGMAAIERQRTRVTCETSRLVSVTPSLLRVKAYHNYNVEFSAVDQFELTAPASVGDDIRFTGADIKEEIHAKESGPDGMTTWTIRLQRRAIGAYQLMASFETPLEAGGANEELKVTVPVTRAVGVARETGHIGVSRGENLEVKVAGKSDGLEARDVKELPTTLASASLGFRYFDPTAQRLELEIIRHETESVLGALVRRMHIDTVVSDQREAMHEAIFEVQNNREQYLELELPENMRILTAFVRGVPAPPTIRQADGARLIELAKSETRDEAFRVRLILGETLEGGKMGAFGFLTFASPKPLNMPVLRSTRKLFLPDAFRYVSFGGDMRLAQGGPAPWIEPAAENLLSDIPAQFAGGVSQPALNPRGVKAPVAYDLAETDDEKRARLQGTALDIPIVREGLQFHFSKLSGIGDIKISYWKRKPLLLLQGVIALLAIAALILVFIKTRRLSICVCVALIAFIAASLTDGLAGRLCATFFSGAVVGALACLALYVVERVRGHHSE